MTDLYRDTIEQLLSEVGDELAAQKFTTPVRIMLIGGAYMLLTQGNRETTEDVDAFMLNIDNLSKKTKETRKFEKAVRTIAKRHGISKSNWLNDVAFDWIDGLGPQPRVVLWKRFNMLEVYLPPEDYILALKLFSYRPKDIPDIQALLKRLNVQTKEEAQKIVNKYILVRWQIEFNVAKALHEIFG